MITLAFLVVQMMCKGVMHLFWATGALHEPNKRASEAVSQRKKRRRGKKTKRELLEVVHLWKKPIHYKL